MDIKKKALKVESREDLTKRKELYEQRKQAEDEQLKRKAIYEALVSKARATGFKEEEISHIIPWTVDDIRFGKRDERYRENWIDTLPLLWQLFEKYGDYLSDDSIKCVVWGYGWDDSWSYYDDADFRNMNWKDDLRWVLTAKEIDDMLKEESLNIDHEYFEEDFENIESIRIEIRIIGAEKRKRGGFPVPDWEMLEIYDEYGYDEERWSVCIGRMQKFQPNIGLFFQKEEDYRGRYMTIRRLSWDFKYDEAEWDEHFRRQMSLIEDFDKTLPEAFYLKYAWELDIDSDSWDLGRERMKKLFDRYRDGYPDKVLIDLAWHSGINDEEWNDRFNVMNELFEEYGYDISSEEVRKLAWEYDIHAATFRNNINKMVFCLQLHKGILSEDEAHHAVFDAKGGIITFPKHVIDECKRKSLSRVFPLEGGVRCPLHGTFLSTGRKIIPDSGGEKKNIYFCDKCGCFYAVRVGDDAPEISFGNAKIRCIRAPKEVPEKNEVIPTISKIRKLLNKSDVKILLTNEDSFRCKECGRNNKVCSGEDAVVIRFVDKKQLKVEGSYCHDCDALTINTRNIEKFSRFFSADYIESVDINIPEIAEEVIKEAISNFDPENSVLHVFRGHIKCQRDGHSVVSATLTVPTADCSKKPTINANFCHTCGKFFVDRAEYLHYMAEYPLIPLNFTSVNDNGEIEYSFLKEQSPLFICGYTVDARVGLTDQERQNILVDIIESGALSKPAVMDYLTQFINRNGRAKGMEKAKEKWERDLDFVRKYNIDKQMKASIDEIKEG